MAQFLIELRRDGRAIGEIVFETHGKVSEAIGEVTSIAIPTEPALEELMREHFDTNPEALSVTGGYAPEDVGAYGEGVNAVLALLQEEHDFTYDPRQIPSPSETGDIR